jgi:integrase/recombinase XerC
MHERPQWFEDFLTDRAVRKPSPHTVQAYRHDFDAIAARITGDLNTIAALKPADLTTDAARRAFADFANTHASASIRRCWSTWNALCAYLLVAQQLVTNPMQLVGKPKPAKTLPKALLPNDAQALLAAIDSPQAGRRRVSDWPERDRAIILTALLAGLRAHELRGTNVGDLRHFGPDHGGVLHVHGKGDKDRAVPVETALIDVLTAYLATRATRFPDAARRRGRGGIWSHWPADAPLFVGPDGQRITRGVLQYRVLRAFKRAGNDVTRRPGAVVHALRHTYATELANTDISVYTLMKLLGHESMATSQRYISGAGADTRDAAARNPLYNLAENNPRTEQVDIDPVSGP